jgi:hypothetical protein
VIRLRLADPQPDDPTAPVDWRMPSLITATLFLNFAFWYVPDWRLPGHSPVWFSSAAAVLLVALFYAGPAFSAQRSRQSLFEVAADSLGSIPALGFRLVCASFLAIWIGQVVCLLVSLSSTWMRVHPAGTAQQRVLAVALVAFLFTTGLQSPRISARLAWLGNKVALALLVVAFIRVRAGLPSAWRATFYPDISGGWQYLSRTCFFAGPLVLLASGFGKRVPTRRGLALMVAGGLVLPIVLCLVAVSIISAAKHVQGVGNIAVALWHGDSTRYTGPEMTLAGVTLFGTVRFSAAVLVESFSALQANKIVRYVLIGLSMCAAAMLSIEILNFWDFTDLMNSVVIALAAAAAVLTADAIARRWRKSPSVRFDWIGVAAFGLGFQAQFCLPVLIGWFPDPWWHPWLLPSYAISFTACLVGRALEKLLRVANRRTSPV